LKLLLEAGADVNAGGGKYSAALKAAAARPKSELNIQILLDAGADINFRGGDHGSALHATISKCSIENMKLLIDAGADVNAIAGLHGTPLQAAAAYGLIKPLKILLAAGADPTTEAGQHGTPLRAAQYYNQSAEMVRLLQKSVVKWSRGALASAGNDDRPASTPAPGMVLGNRNDTYSEYEAAHMDTNLASVISKSALQAEA
jgi:ankyrin repeat protein